jgi:hypothetical protein
MYFAKENLVPLVVGFGTSVVLLNQGNFWWGLGALIVSIVFLLIPSNVLRDYFNF